MAIPKSTRTLFIALFLVGLVIIGLAFLAWFSARDANQDTLLRPNKEALVISGMEIYRAQCAICHGDNLQGQPDWKTPDGEGLLPAPPHDESGHTWHHTDELLFELTKSGLAKIAGLENYKTNMPVYEGLLTDNEIISVLSYIKSTWPDNLRQRHDQLNQQARRAN